MIITPKAIVSILLYIVLSGCFSVEAQAQRNGLPTLDYRWASHFHQMIDEIEKKDLASFEKSSYEAIEDRKDATLAQIYERDLLIWFLRRDFKSPEASVSELSTEWNSKADQNWHWETLLALTDILKRLKKDQSLLQQDVRTKLEAKFRHLDALHDRAIISNPELARYAIQYVRRIEDYEMAFLECRRLLTKLPNDFAIASITTERLSSLFKLSPDKWQQFYDDYLSKVAEMLNDDDKLLVRYPLAFPKVLFEQSRLKSKKDARFEKLSEALKACEDTKFLLNQKEDRTGAETKRNNLVLSQLKASVMLDGYRLKKTFSKELKEENRSVAQKYESLFHVTSVASALRDVLAQMEIILPSAKLNLQLSLAGVLLDSVQQSSALRTQDIAAQEKELLAIIDQSKDSIYSLEKQSPVVSQLDRLNQELELTWAEWSMQRSVSLTLKPEDSFATLAATGVQLSDELGRLKCLKERIGTADGTLLNRVITDIGFVYLKRGAYQDAIGVFDNRDVGNQFLASVILCLAYKDSGQIEKARKVLDELDGGINGKGQLMQRRLVYLLQSELSIESDQVDSKAIRNLRDSLNNQDETSLQPNVALEVSLRQTNEHHQAIALKELEPEALADLIEPSSDQPKLALARKIWTKHLEGNYPAFVKSRAAYSLAAISIDRNEKLDALQRQINKLTECYRKELKSFNDTDRTDEEAFRKLTAKSFEIKFMENEIRTILSTQLEDGIVRSRILDAIKFMPTAGDYPNLRYNIFCLALRVHLLSPNNKFELDLKNAGWPLNNIASAACEAAIQQRLKISNEGVFGNERDSLFERYRDGFDLAVDFSVSRLNFREAARIAAATSNLSVCDLRTQFKLDLPPQSYSLESIRLPTDPFVSFFVGRLTTHIFWRFGKEDEEVRHHQINIDRPVLVSTVETYVNAFLKNFPTEKFQTKVSALPDASAVMAFDSAREFSQRLFTKSFLSDLSELAISNPDMCINVVPHGPLFQLPLDTLPIDGTAENGVFLATKCPPLIYLPSLTAPKEVRFSKMPESQPLLLTIQPGADVGSECELLYKKFEKEGATWLTPKQQRYSSLGSGASTSLIQATCESVLDELSNGYRFVHFGCHGEAIAGDKSLIGGANLKLWNKSPLSALDLIKRFSRESRQSLNTELVFLSACETQVTDQNALRYGGNTIKALGTAFLVSGAQNVIASHWRVNNQSTKALVLNFMEQVKENREEPNTSKTYARILHNARKSLASNEDFASPCHWGAFTISTFLEKSSGPEQN